MARSFASCPRSVLVYSKQRNLPGQLQALDASFPIAPPSFVSFPIPAIQWSMQSMNAHAYHTPWSSICIVLLLCLRSLYFSTFSLLDRCYVDLRQQSYI